MLLCRVTLDRIYQTTEFLPGLTRPIFSGVNYDSVVADPAAGIADQIHREWIVYERHQSYAEFVVYYKIGP